MTNDERPPGRHRTGRPAGNPSARPPRPGRRAFELPSPPVPARRKLPVLTVVRATTVVAVAALAIVAVDHGVTTSGGHGTIVEVGAGAKPKPSTSAAKSATATATATASSGTTAPASPDATTTPLPPAPDGFAAGVDDLYGDMRETAVAGSLPTPSLPETSQFDADMAQLSPTDLALFYDITQKTANWNTLAPTFSGTLPQVQAAVATAGGPAVVARAVARDRAAAPSGTSGTATKKAARALPAAPTATATALETYEPDSTPAPFQAGDCPQGAPGGDDGEDSLFATQIAVDALTEATGGVPAEIVSGFGNVTVPDPVKIVLEVLLFVATIIHDTFDYLQSVAGDCGGDNSSAELDNIDNTTYDTYTLLSSIGQTTNEIDAGVAKLLTGAAATAQQQLMLSIEAALAAPDTSVPVVAYEIPASAGGFLDAQPVGVQSIVTDALETMNDAGQPVNPLASRSLVRADQALGAKQYKAAWTLFRQTYAYIAS